MCPPRCRVSRLVTLDTPHASPLAPCVSHERSLCPGHFWPEVWHMYAEHLCSVQPACPYGSKVVTLTSVPGCSWPPRVPGVGLPSSLQTRIISSAMIHPKWPSVCTGENCHTAGAIVTNIMGGGQHWEKLLWTLAVEEVHTVCIFTGDKAPGGCGRVKFSLLITYFFDVPRKQVSVCQWETKCWLKLWCYTRCTLCSLDSIIFTIVEKHFLPQVFLWWQENLFLLLSTGHLSKKSSGNWTLKLNPMRAASVFNVYWLLFVWSKISEQSNINNTFLMYLSIWWEKHMLTRVRVSFVI